MTAAQLAWSGMFPTGRFSLDVIAKNLLKPLDISKVQQKSFIGQPVDQEFTIEQVAYAATDTLVTHRLYPEILKRLENVELLDVYNTMENPLLNHLVRTESKGILTDVEALAEQHEKKLDEIAEIEAELQRLYLEMPEPRPKVSKGKFNPNSPAQIISVMAARGLKLKSSGMDDLEEARINFEDPFLDKIIEHKKIYTRYIKLFNKWVDECINPATDCIHPTYYPCGASQTGRLSCVDAGTQILTKDGYKSIVDLFPGEDQVLTHAEQYQKIDQLIFKGLEQMYEVELEDGSKLTCTGKHQLLTENGWECLENLDEGSSILVNGKS
jgi:DNA polymerase-1